MSASSPLSYFNPVPGNGIFGQNGIQLYHTTPVVNNRAALFELRVVVTNSSTTKTRVTVGSLFTPAVLSVMFPYIGPTPFDTSVLNMNKVNKQTVQSKPTHNTILKFVFPISPTGLKKMVDHLNTAYLVAGSAQNFNNPGVSREMDMFGQTPPSWIIEGTTGWKYHSNDGGTIEGIQAFHNLQYILTQYNYFVQIQARLQNKIQYHLELYDYFNQDYWVVVPSGQQVFDMNANRPLVGNYRLSLLGIRPVKSPPKPLLLKSALAQRLSSTVSNAASSIAGFATGVGSAFNELSGGSLYS